MGDSVTTYRHPEWQAALDGRHFARNPLVWSRKPSQTPIAS
jgi:hypothetical protein